MIRGVAPQQGLRHQLWLARSFTATRTGVCCEQCAPAHLRRFLMCRNVVASARGFRCRQPLLSTVRPLRPLVMLSVAFLMVVSRFGPA